MMIAIQNNVQVGDYVIFSSTNRNGMGEIVSASATTVHVKIVKEMDSSTLQDFNISPITPTDFPLASQDGLVEVYKTQEVVSLERSLIRDVAFFVPIQEVESGMFYMSGAENTFYIRYIKVNNSMQQCMPSFYFSRYLVEPLGVRLFTAMNTLSQHLRRAMYHQPESVISRKSFHLPMFSMESFWYLYGKLNHQSIGVSIKRKQNITKYYNTLMMENCCKTNTLTYIRILSLPALEALRKVLGKGVGLGLAKKRPTKATPEGYCTIGRILTSVECALHAPAAVLLKPEGQCGADGIDFLYSEENRALSCTIRFTKVVVRDERDATSRIAIAHVTTPDSGVYLNVWFQYHDSLLEAVAIDGSNVLCSHVEEPDRENLELPLQLVKELVARFGNS
jgi:hypothetical protein